MGRDLSFKINGDWEHVPVASRKNEVLGYINRRFTKKELREYIGKLIDETRSYDYNMNDISNAISSLEYIMQRLYSENLEVDIRYM